MEPRLFRLTVVLAVLAFTIFAVIAGFEVRTYYSETANAEEYRDRARLEELENKEAGRPPLEPNRLVPFEGKLDDPVYRFDWKTMELNSKTAATRAKSELVEILLVALIGPAIILGVFYAIRWIITGRVRPWIPK